MCNGNCSKTSGHSQVYPVSVGHTVVYEPLAYSGPAVVAPIVQVSTACPQCKAPVSVGGACAPCAAKLAPACAGVWPYHSTGCAATRTYILPVKGGVVQL